MYTVEPPNKGHALRVRYNFNCCVFCGEVVPFLHGGLKCIRAIEKHIFRTLNCLLCREVYTTIILCPYLECPLSDIPLYTATIHLLSYNFCPLALTYTQTNVGYLTMVDVQEHENASVCRIECSVVTAWVLLSQTFPTALANVFVS